MEYLQLLLNLTCVFLILETPKLQLPKLDLIYLKKESQEQYWIIQGEFNNHNIQASPGNH